MAAERARLIEAVKRGDTDAARALLVESRRRGDRAAQSAAARALVAHGCWRLDHGVHQHTGSSRLADQIQRFACLPDAGVAAVVIGESTESAHERAAVLSGGVPSVAAEAAERALEALLDRAILAGLLASEELDVTAERLLSASARAVRLATGHQQPRRGHIRRRRGWLPRRHRRRRRQRGTRRTVRTSASVAAFLCRGTRACLARSGDACIYRHRAPHFERLLPRHLASDAAATITGQASGRAALEDGARPRPESDAETRILDLDPDDVFVLVGAAFEDVRPVLSPGRLIGDGTLSRQAESLVDTWQEVASPRVRNAAEHELGALLLRVVPHVDGPPSSLG